MLQYVAANPLDAISLVCSLAVALYAIPLLIHANGTRPFILGYLIISISVVLGAIGMGWRELHGGGPEPTFVLSGAVRRMLGAVFIFVTLIWAQIRNRGGHGS